MLRHKLLCGSDSLLYSQTVQRELSAGRVTHDTLLGVVALLRDIGTLNQRNDGEVEVLGKCIVTRVMGRYSHDGTSTIASQHIFCNPNGNFLVVKRIDGIRAREHTRHLMIHLTVALSTLLHIVKIFFHLFFLLRCGKFCYKV